MQQHSFAQRGSVSQEIWKNTKMHLWQEGLALTYSLQAGTQAEELPLPYDHIIL